ncbi:MAG: glucose-6-phosphate isomerase [Erysipelotrichales bacterium]|nr:glucose-6-phosphate isomerase [Erysipelotrichales bacterium]
MISVDYSKVLDFINLNDLPRIGQEVTEIHYMLHKREGAGSEALGWLDWPIMDHKETIAKINACANRLRKISDVIIVIGIGGSYLGSRAGIEFLDNYFSDKKPEIVYAGHHLSSEYLCGMISHLKDKNFSLIVISKSGKTTEPAVYFRILKQILESKYSKEESKERIVVVTDPKSGILRNMANKEGYESFDIPENVGGRFSVLTACGLLPLACAGFDIKKILKGAEMAYQNFLNPDVLKNDCYKYAAIRNILYRYGHKIEIIANYEPKLNSLSEWWRQLFGESEGKNGMGLFVSKVGFTTDLHAIGQYIQDGERILFETVINVQKVNSSFYLPEDKEDADGLNYLLGKNLTEINNSALIGTMLAHIEGGVPNILINLQELSEEVFGYLVYFFKKACAISGYLLGVNPFNQPGVEAYKDNMFALLGKKGYEDLRKKIKQKGL